MFDRLRDKFGEYFITELFFGLMKNVEFKEKFISRYEFLIVNLFNEQRMLQQIEDFEKRYRIEIERHIARWKRPEYIRTWNQLVQEMKVFAQQRQGAVIEHIGYL